MSSDQSSIEEDEIRQNKLVFLLDEVNKTACVSGNDDAGPEIFIPRSVQYQNQEYLVTCIKKCSFKNSKTIISIQAPNDSELKTIEKESFAFSTVEQIFIPFSVIELKEGWCLNTPQLKKVSISSKNPNFILIDEKMIVGKSKTRSDEYDAIVFTSRNTKEVIIPSFITKIRSFAFSETKIESIYIPLHITKICDGAFYCCRELKKVEFPLDSELKIIGKKAFSKTSIQYILIPLHVTKICEGSFHNCHNLQKVEFLPDSELKTIETDAFSKTSIESITIPSSVTNLEEGWCSSSTKLIRIVLTQSEKAGNDQDVLKTDNHHDSSEIDEKMIVQTLLCPVCCYAMVPPMRTPMIISECGHSICQMCISKLSECPYCHQKITNTMKNILALQLIETIDQNKLIPEERRVISKLYDMQYNVKYYYFYDLFSIIVHHLFDQINIQSKFQVKLLYYTDRHHFLTLCDLLSVKNMVSYFFLCVDEECEFYFQKKYSSIINYKFKKIDDEILHTDFTKDGLNFIVHSKYPFKNDRIMIPYYAYQTLETFLRNIQKYPNSFDLTNFIHIKFII